jgi:hypothetical protein
MSTVITNSVGTRYGPISPSTPSWSGGAGIDLDEGLVDRAWRETVVTWRAPSRYLRGVFGGDDHPARTSAWSFLTTACFAASAVCLIFLAVTDRSSVLLIAGLTFGFIAYTWFWNWVSRNKHRSGIHWFLERVRSCLAGSGDPGPH